MTRSPDDQRPETAKDGGHGRTRILHADGERWFVHEVAAPVFDRRRDTHLLFEAVNVMRRVRVFPSDWFELSDDDLYALSVHIRPGDGPT